MSIFSPEEILARQRRVQEALREAGVDACLLTSADNVYYLSGMPLLSEWGRPMWLTLPAVGDATLIGAEIESESMQTHAPCCAHRTYADERDVRAAALDLAVDAIGPVECIGAERAVIPVEVYEALLSRTGARRSENISATVADARLRKSPAELELLGVAAEVAKIGANAFLEALTPANTELTISTHAVAEMNRALGALLPTAAASTYAYCQIGDHSLTPHLHPTGRRLARGEIVALNVFPVVWGYCIELERTLVFGPPDDRQAGYLETLDAAFTLGKDSLRPGRRFSDVHDVVTELLDERGVGQYVRHGTGHAHGIMVGAASREEHGEIRGYNDRELEPGMINSVEPGFYVPGTGGFRHSDVLVIEDDDARCITEFPTHLSL